DRAAANFKAGLTRSMRTPPDGRGAGRAEHADIDIAPHRPIQEPADVVKQEDEMSASTQAIQQPASHGSLLGAVAMGTAALLAVGAIAWGALNMTATKHSATPVQAPAFLDRGSRIEAAAPGSILDKGGRSDFTPLGAAYVQGAPGNVTPRFDAIGSTVSGPVYVLPGNQVAVPGFLK